MTAVAYHLAMTTSSTRGRAAAGTTVPSYVSIETAPLPRLLCVLGFHDTTITRDKPKPGSQGRTPTAVLHIVCKRPHCPYHVAKRVDFNNNTVELVTPPPHIG